MAPATKKTETFAKLKQTDPSDFIAVPTECIELAGVTNFPLYLKVSGKYIQFRSHGQTLPTEKVDSLKKKNVDTLLVTKTNWTELVRALEKRVEGFLASDVDVDTALLGLRHLLLCLLKDVEEKRDLYKPTVSKLMQLTEKLTKGIKELPTVGETLVRRYKDPRVYFSNHSVNVAVLACRIGCKLELPLHEVLTLTLAALLHNVGNLTISPEILYKQLTLTKEEWREIRRHPLRGSEMLEKFSLPREVLLTALQHHERLDGGGYPSNLQSNEIHPYASICAAADVTDAIQSHRPYQGPLEASTVAPTLEKMRGKLDGKILDLILSWKV